MGKFVIECPECGSYVEVSTGLFAKKMVKCSCGNIINTKEEMLSSKVCPHCGNTVMFDQRKGEKATCPICHQKINTVADKIAFVELTCPNCSTKQKVNKNNATHVCSVCGYELDVKKWMARTKLKESGSASVIKWDGSENLLIFKHPIEEFNEGSQLVVKQGQEALVVRDGVVTDTFGMGRYNLEDGAGVEIYFVNKLTLTNARWGTPTKVRVMEQTFNFPVEIGARGSFNLEIFNAKALLSRLIGNAKSYVANVDDEGEGYSIEYIRDKFSDMITQNITAMLARILTENKINLFIVDSIKENIAKLLGIAVSNSLNEFGLQIPAGQFYVTEIVTPDDDPNYIRMKNQYASSLDLRDMEIEAKKISASADLEIAKREASAKIRMVDAQSEAEVAKVSAQGSADSVVIEAKGEAEKIKLEGHASVDVYRDQAKAEAEALKEKGGDYKMESERLVGEAMAENGVSVVNVNIQKESEWTCSSCGKTGITSNFCPDCGEKRK